MNNKKNALLKMNDPNMPTVSIYFVGRANSNKIIFKNINIPK
jgi:hypothetical protein